MICRREFIGHFHAITRWIDVQSTDVHMRSHMTPGMLTDRRRPDAEQVRRSATRGRAVRLRSARRRTSTMRPTSRSPTESITRRTRRTGCSITGMRESISGGQVAGVGQWTHVWGDWRRRVQGDRRADTRTTFDNVRRACKCRRQDGWMDGWMTNGLVSGRASCGCL